MVISANIADCFWENIQNVRLLTWTGITKVISLCIFNWFIQLTYNIFNRFITVHCVLEIRFIKWSKLVFVRWKFPNLRYDSGLNNIIFFFCFYFLFSATWMVLSRSFPRSKQECLISTSPIVRTSLPLSDWEKFLHSGISVTECIGIVWVRNTGLSVCLSVCVCVSVCVSVCLSALERRNH